MATLEAAITLAANAHRGSTERNGQPYILHPLRVMLGMETEEEMIVAVLHDVIEDTEVSLEALVKAGFSSAIVAAVDALSRRKDETYESFIERVSRNPLAVRIKLSDLRDNMDIRRIPDLEDKDLQRLHRYHHAWKRLTGSDGEKR